MNILNKNQEILLTIKRVGINGEGIGYYKRLAVFVPLAIPGEDVVIRITDVFDQYAKGIIVKQKGQESLSRVKPTCPYYESCGGCHLSHMDYAAQLKTKKALVMEAFDRYFDVSINPKIFKDTIGMEEPWRYRNKVKLPVRYDGEKLVTGLYEARSNRLVYIDYCDVEKKDIREAVNKILAHLTKAEVIAYEPRIKEGVLRHLVLRSSSLTKEIQVTLILYKNDPRTIKIAKELIKIDNIVSVYISINDDEDAIENFGETSLLIGKPTITEKIGDLEFNLLATSFFQLNLTQTEKLYQEVARVAKLRGDEKIIDGFCGVGTIGLWLSKNSKEVRGIDNNKEAIINANENAKLNRISNAKFYYGNLLPHLYKFKKEGFTPDVFIVDPPRKGMELSLIKYLQDNPVDKLIYVSCNPSTLAKNCNHLNSKYHILSIQPIDMFPQTSSVEAVCLLERRRG